MRYWKCMGYNKTEKNFTIGKIYESDNEGYNIINNNKYKFTATDVKYLKMWYKFEEVTRRDYLFQLQKEGKLKFNEQDFVNGDLAIRFKEECEFSKKLKKICEKNKIYNPNNYNFNSYASYGVVNNIVDMDSFNPCITKLPFIESKNIKVEFTSKPNDYDNFSINIHSKDGITTCKYWLNDKLENESTVKLYHKDEFNVQTAVEEVLKKTFMKKPYELFEYELENKLGRKPSAMELVEAYRKEIK